MIGLGPTFLVRDDLQAQYDAEFSRRCPLYTGGVEVVLGGWHTTWPEDSFYLPREVTLVVWTFCEAEPWYEVWMDQNFNLDVKERIT